MDLDYNTVKYLVIILSFIVLGYVIYLLYNELVNVKTDFTKIKTKITSVEDDVDYVKGLITVEEEEDAEDDNQNFSELLNNNGFLNSLNLNYSKLTEYPTETELSEIQEIEEIDETEETPQETSDDIEFVSSDRTCDTILASGKNKGKKCTKTALDNTTKCLKHTDKSIRKETKIEEDVEI